MAPRPFASIRHVYELVRDASLNADADADADADAQAQAKAASPPGPESPPPSYRVLGRLVSIDWSRPSARIRDPFLHVVPAAGAVRAAATRPGTPTEMEIDVDLRHVVVAHHPGPASRREARQQPPPVTDFPRLVPGRLYQWIGEVSDEPAPAAAAATAEAPPGTAAKDQPPLPRVVLTPRLYWDADGLDVVLYHTVVNVRRSIQR
ncbi:hypothetical protein CXG81DRAFT_18968 [Caulochytrium protostelioides]|uniref:Uncharacterized protein n=1 Tax=Caulochytrium protostelioides TaxID=1555241 RepID=A0A4P9WV82_9FUNG|nr:hypothetical protein CAUPRSCDRAFT_11914 [Caulochytrium protostelioides]RKP01194.1 hypothetical protein CXG81DRAFT_18968 [Caulochytrium protostelioides]|eukprot:RKP01194.1 hypothetical protein CXG81DRAFT_18968 [Caulochytrium protostelioides]